MLSGAAAAPTVSPSLTPGEETAITHISEASLRGHVSFLASDLLEGRDTPSRGLDIAAEYLAAQFRRAGLDPSFQSAEVIRTKATAELAVTNGNATANGDRAGMRVRSDRPLTLANAPVYKLDLAAAHPRMDVLKGKVVVFSIGAGQTAAAGSLWPTLMSSQAAAVVVIGERGREFVASNLFVPGAEPSLPAVSVTTPAVADLCRSLRPGPSSATITLRISIVSRTAATAKNVVALLRGSDPELRDTCVVLSAHYDHLGRKGDAVYNGANDDASGAASVLEIASAMAAMPAGPRRSVVFVTFFGEEGGLYGSKYFARHLPCPRDRTVAAVNLEQLGRPDTDKGPMPDAIAFIGKSFTTIPDEFASAAAATGVSIVSSSDLGDDFFARSDNLSLAEDGIPAQTVAIPAMFADYHAVSDKWPKIDFANMARLDRMLALGLIRLADDPQPPHWNTENPKTREYAAPGPLR